MALLWAGDADDSGSPECSEDKGSGTMRENDQGGERALFEGGCPEEVSEKVHLG